MLKVIQDFSCFALLRLVIAPGNSRLYLNQSDAKRFFPRALYSQVDFTLSFLWQLKVFSLPLIDRFDKFGFGFTTLNRRESTLSAPDGYFKAWQIWTCWYVPWLCSRRTVMGTADETCIVWTEVLLTMVNNTSGNRYALFWSPFFFSRRCNKIGKIGESSKEIHTSEWRMEGGTCVIKLSLVNPKERCSTIWIFVFLPRIQKFDSYLAFWFVPLIFTLQETL